MVGLDFEVDEKPYEKQAIAQIDNIIIIIFDIQNY